ncbi:MAG: TrkA family potassium uptake protein [Methanobacterium sp. ERen5]|nr:MAG: TrkA family potassium uptake protein [Methanobacterium sp. ERen5]
MGGGRLGLKLAKELIFDGHDLTLIEQDEAKCNFLTSEIDEPVLCGNATDKITLKNAEISDADAFVAATGNDETNLLAALMAKKLGAKKIIARLNEPQHEPIFVSNNFITVVVPETIEAGYLEKLVLKPKVADLFVVDHGNGELLELELNNSKLIGKTVGEMNSQEDFFICGIYDKQRSEVNIANYSTLITKNCKLIVLTKKEAVGKVLKLFTN